MGYILISIESKKEGTIYDDTIKELFRGYERELIKYFSGLDVEELQPLNLEFKRTQSRTCDLLLKGHIKEKGDMVIHTEFQSKNDRNMLYRMLRYAVEIYEEHERPIYQLVLYLGSKPMRMDDSLHLCLGECNYLQYGYKIIDIGSLGYKGLKETNDPLLYPLLPLTERETRKKKKEGFLQGCIEDIINSDFNIEEKREVAFKAQIFAGLAFKKDIIDKIFTEVEQMLFMEESAGYQRILEKGKSIGIEEGKKEGRNIGIEEGKKEGRNIGIKEVALPVLKEKFMYLPEEYIKKLELLDADTLSAIMRNILRVNTKEDLEKFLH